MPIWCYRILAYGLLAAVLIATGYIKGIEHESELRLEEQAKAAKLAVAIVTKQGAVTVRVVTQFKDRIVVVEGATITIEKEIPVYVTKEADAGCTIPTGFVQLHDAAAAGSVPEAATGNHDSPSGVALSAIAETVNANYGTYHKVSAELLACQSWVRDQYETTNGTKLSWP